jgi:hypothetical protein
MISFDPNKGTLHLDSENVFPEFPSNFTLRYLILTRCSLVILPQLPDTLESFVCLDTTIENFPQEFPMNLTYVRLNPLPNFPKSWLGRVKDFKIVN